MPDMSTLTALRDRPAISVNTSSDLILCMTKFACKVCIKNGIGGFVLMGQVRKVHIFALYHF